MSNFIFEARNVNFRYNEVAALQDVSLRIPIGQRVAAIGANGSGKSTFLRLLNGLYFADGGEILFDGHTLSEGQLANEAFSHNFRQRVGLVFQNPDVQLFNPTVFDELAFGPLQLRWERDRIHHEVGRALDQMEIGHLKQRSPHRLSGGEKKRVALASVLILDPEVLLLDEPTAALDPKSQSQMIDFLVDWAGVKTVVIATHDLDTVADIADHCVVFGGGRVLATGAPAQILGDEQLLYDAHLIHAHRHRHGALVHSHPHGHHSHSDHTHQSTSESQSHDGHTHGDHSHDDHSHGEHAHEGPVREDRTSSSRGIIGEGTAEPRSGGVEPPQVNGGS